MIKTVKIISLNSRRFISLSAEACDGGEFGLAQRIMHVHRKGFPVIVELILNIL